jgi:PDZ domain-containing protein
VRRSTWTLLSATIVMLCLGVVGATVPVPVAALGVGPTFDTLGQHNGKPVVDIASLPTYPTSGHLNMTTVQVTDGLTMFQTIRMWASGDYQVVPRSSVFRPGESDEQVDAENKKQFADSQADAKGAALSYLHLPTRVVVGLLADGSPAAGVLAVGDQLVAVDGHVLQSIDDLHAALNDTRPGQQVTVQLRRGDEPPRDVVVTLAARSDAPQGMLGVTPVARPLTDDEITISLSDVGGSSAGLMFALATVDRLTPGELTGGLFVAGTGTIRSDGVVAPIRGIPFKMAAARRAGATVFLVPAANCEEARSTAPDGLQLVRVDTLGGAVAGLDQLRSGAAPASC